MVSLFARPAKLSPHIQTNLHGSRLTFGHARPKINGQEKGQTMSAAETNETAEETTAEELTTEELTTEELTTEEPTTKVSDFELAQRSAEGDREAFEQLYHRHFRRVFALCLRMTTNASTAEDLTQEVFIHLFNKIGSFRGDSAFTTWLHRMTVNHVLMYFRKSSTRSELLTTEGETPVQIVRGTENQDKMPIVDRIALEKAISELPPGYRSVFVLHDVEGYEHEEIGRMLGCSTGTSKSQLHKARLKLRDLIRRQAAQN
jgi:RNA polymerase sigma-70 factor (ECF subfamily)